jgi:hypothetical protein
MLLLLGADFFAASGVRDRIEDEIAGDELRLLFDVRSS